MSSVYRCDVCGALTPNRYRTSIDWKYHSICDKCCQMSDEQRNGLDKDARFAVVCAQIIADNSDDG